MKIFYVNILQSLQFKIRWAEVQCVQKKLEKTGENIRKVLGDCLFHIRFPLMSAPDFVEFVSPEKILTMSEESEILKYIIMSEKEGLVFH